MRLRSGHIIEGPKSDYCMTMNAVLASSNVHSGLAYPHPNLTKIIGKPTPVTLKLFTKEVYANAPRTIPCHHDGNRYGHLGLVMSDAEYAALTTATAFPTLADPGDVPPIKPGADGVVITNTMKTYEQTLFRYQTRIQVENDLKQMIIGAVEPLYISSQEHRTLGFSNKIAQDLFAHLITTYGEIKESGFLVCKGNLRLGPITHWGWSHCWQGYDYQMEMEEIK